MTFDLLHSPDGLVDDVEATIEAMVTKLGLMAPKPTWMQISASHGYKAMFARVNRSRAVAPSRLEIISDFPKSRSGPTDISANLAQIERAQASRPLKTHATVLTTSAMPELYADLVSRGVRCRMDPPSADLGHERLWIGYSHGSEYSPEDDAGLMLEFIPTQCLALPEPPPHGQVVAEVAEASGAVVRVAARSYLVDDLDATLTTLADRFAWSPRTVRGVPGRRCARMDLSLQRSAVLELIEANYDEDAKSFYGAYGHGTFSTRLTVGDLAAKEGDLRERGTPFHYLSRDGQADILRVELGVVPGFLFDFVAEQDENDDEA